MDELSVRLQKEHLDRDPLKLEHWSSIGTKLAARFGQMAHLMTILNSKAATTRLYGEKEKYSLARPIAVPREVSSPRK